MEYTGLDIVNILKKYQLTQEELGNRIGSSRKTIINYIKTNVVTKTKWEILDNVVKEEEARLDRSRQTNAIDRGPLEGDFEKHTTRSGNEYQIVSDGNHRMTVKVVEQVAYAGYLAGWSDPEYIETLPTTIITVKKFHTGTYRVFEVSGDSMDYEGKRAIESGDCVIAHRVDNDLWFKSKLHIHDWKEWVIVHDEGIIIKQITKHDVENGLITCRSYNPDKNIYPDFELPLERVYELYNVVKIEKSR